MLLLRTWPLLHLEQRAHSVCAAQRKAIALDMFELDIFAAFLKEIFIFSYIENVDMGEFIEDMMKI